MESLKEDLRSVDLALKSLQAVHDSEWKSLGGTVADESKVAISSCKRACDTFRADLQRWTRHSEEGKLSWQDRANVGFFKQRQIKFTSEQLQTCMLTINSVVGIATLYCTTCSSKRAHGPVEYFSHCTICTRFRRLGGPP